MDNIWAMLVVTSASLVIGIKGVRLLAAEMWADRYPGSDGWRAAGAKKENAEA